MLKKITLISFLFLNFIAQAQVCELPNGNFESWDDITDDLGLLEAGIPEETVLVPEGFFPLIRFFFADLIGIFEAFTGEELVEATSNLFGIQRSVDATEGSYSIQLSSDKMIPFAGGLKTFHYSG